MADGIEKMQTISLDDIELVYINEDFADVRLLPKSNIGARSKSDCHHFACPQISSSSIHAKGTNLQPGTTTSSLRRNSRPSGVVLCQSIRPITRTTC